MNKVLAGAKTSSDNSIIHANEKKITIKYIFIKSKYFKKSHFFVPFHTHFSHSPKQSRIWFWYYLSFQFNFNTSTAYTCTQEYRVWSGVFFKMSITSFILYHTHKGSLSQDVLLNAATCCINQLKKREELCAKISA